MERERERVVLLSLCSPPCRCPFSEPIEQIPLFSSACVHAKKKQKHTHPKFHFPVFAPSVSFFFLAFFWGGGWILILCLARADITVPSQKAGEREKEREGTTETLLHDVLWLIEATFNLPQALVWRESEREGGREEAEKEER